MKTNIRTRLYGLLLFGTILLLANVLENPGICVGVMMVIGLLLALMFFHMSMLNPAETSPIPLLLLQYASMNLIRLYGWFLNRQLESAGRKSKEYQKEMLIKIVKYLASTKFGKDRVFQNIKSVSDFRMQQPLTRYVDYLPYVDEIIQHGSPDILSRGHCDYVAMTTGTVSGQSKGFPVTVKSKEKLIKTSFVATFARLFSYPEHMQLQKFYFLKIYPRITKTPSNVRKGALSGLLAGVNVPYMISPSEDTKITTMDEGMYINILFGIKEKYIGLMCMSTPSLTLAFIKRLEKDWKQCCEDLETGRVSDDLKISEEVRHKLNSCLRGPDPKRAAELQCIFSDGFHDIITRIWPNCSAVWMMTSGPFHIQANVLQEKYLGAARLVDILHGATEGAFGWNMEPNKWPADFTMSGTVTFFEFITACDIHKEQPKTLLPHEVKVGEEYEIVITTVDGLCRYRTQDVIRITGFLGGFPKYQLTRRANDELNLVTEKLPEILISKSLNKALDDWPELTVIDYTTTENFNTENLTGDFTGNLFYVMFLETERIRITQNLADEVDVHLQNSVDYYATFRDKGVIQGLSIVQVKRGTFSSLYRMLVDRNPHSTYTQYKTPRVLRDEQSIKLLMDNKI